MKLSTVHKQRLAKIARVASAGALVVGSVATAAPAASVDAARMSGVSMTLTDTRPNQTSTYTLRLNPTTVTNIKAIAIKYCMNSGAYNDACTDPTASNAASFSVAGATVEGFGDGNTDDNIVDTDDSGVSGNVATIVLDQTAASGNDENPATVHTIELPGNTNADTAQTYYARIRTFSDTAATVQIDGGQAAFALVTPVQVEGTVLENMTFQVAAVTAGACGTGATVTATTATATSIPFGNFQSGTPRVGCHTIATGTNAAGGYVTKVQTVNPGAAPQGAMCRQTAGNCSSVGAASTVGAGNYIVDTGLSSTSATWTPATTYGFGVSANGGRAITTAGNFSTAGHYKQIVGSTGVNLAQHTGPDTLGNSLTHVVYQADVPVNQTAGVYQNQLEYISTPTF